jgi:hypothetical protein
MENYITYIFAGSFGVIVFLIVLGFKIKAKRKREYNELAAELGFSYNPASVKEGFGDLGGFKLFSKGRAQRAKNVLERQSHDIRCSIFDYSYTTGAGNNSSTYTQTVICFRSPLLKLPSFILRPENMFDKIGGLVGKKDFDFDDTPEFSRKYLLAGEDEESVRAVFNQELRTYFETRLHMCVEGDGAKLIIYRNAKRTKPLGIKVALEGAFELFNMLKSE